MADNEKAKKEREREKGPMESIIEALSDIGRRLDDELDRDPYSDDYDDDDDGSESGMRSVIEPHMMYSLMVWLHLLAQMSHGHVATVLATQGVVDGSVEKSAQRLHALQDLSRFMEQTYHGRVMTVADGPEKDASIQRLVSQGSVGGSPDDDVDFNYTQSAAEASRIRKTIYPHEIVEGLAAQALSIINDCHRRQLQRQEADRRRRQSMRPSSSSSSSSYRQVSLPTFFDDDDQPDRYVQVSPGSLSRIDLSSGDDDDYDDDYSSTTSDDEYSGGDYATSSDDDDDDIDRLSHGLAQMSTDDSDTSMYSVAQRQRHRDAVTLKNKKRHRRRMRERQRRQRGRG